MADELVIPKTLDLIEGTTLEVLRQKSAILAKIGLPAYERLVALTVAKIEKQKRKESK